MRWAPLCLVLLGLAGTGHAQVISGTLREAESRAPLRGGVVSLLGRDSVAVSEARTDSAGAFSLALPGAGAFRLRASLAGYRAAVSPVLHLGARDTLEVEFTLARDTVVLEPLVVRARSRRLTGAARRFYDRARTHAGSGTFITRDEIDRVNPLRATDLLRRIPGVQATPLPGGNHVTVRGGCLPTVYVDGTRVHGYRSIDDLVHPMELEGVEVYRSPHEAPPAYTGMHAGCAVVLLWTRVE